MDIWLKRWWEARENCSRPALATFSVGNFNILRIEQVLKIISFRPFWAAYNLEPRGQVDRGWLAGNRIGKGISRSRSWDDNCALKKQPDSKVYHTRQSDITSLDATSRDDGALYKVDAGRWSSPSEVSREAAFHHLICLLTGFKLVSISLGYLYLMRALWICKTLLYSKMS